MNSLKSIHKGQRELVSGVFNLEVFSYGEFEVIMVFWINNNPDADPYIRVQLGCLLGSAFGDKNCDCGQQIANSLKLIHEHGTGALIYLPTYEGKGKGLINKFKLAEVIESTGLPPYKAAKTCGIVFEEDDLEFVPEVIKNIGLTMPVVLLSSNTSKIFTLNKFGLVISDLINIPINNNSLSDKGMQEIGEKQEKYSQDLRSYLEL